MAERLSKKTALGKLPEVRDNDPVAELFRHVTRSSLVYTDWTGEGNEDYTQAPDLLMEARSYTLGMVVSVEFSITRIARRPVSGIKFANGRNFAVVHPIGLNPYSLEPDEWMLHTTIGPGLVLARHMMTMGIHPDLETGLNNAISSHRFIYPGKRPH